MNYFSSCAVYDPKRGFLVFDHAKSNSVRFPGGKLDTHRGESPVQAAARELLEEVGITPAHTPRFLGSKYYQRLDGREWHGYLFIITAWVGEPRICEPAKHSNLRWLPLASCVRLGEVEGEIAKLAQFTPIQCRILDTLVEFERSDATEEQLAARLGISYRTWTEAMMRVRHVVGIYDRKRHRSVVINWWKQFHRS